MTAEALTITSWDRLKADVLDIGAEAVTRGEAWTNSPGAHPAFQPQSPPPRSQGDSTTVEATNIDDAVPWLPARLAQLNQLQKLAQSWESTGAAPPNQVAIVHARSILLALTEIDREPSHIDPSTDQGVSLSFRSGNHYAAIECFNTGEILAATKVRGEPPVIWGVPSGSVRVTLDKISSFIDE